MTLRLVEAGAFTTVQDLGRPGLGSYGVPPSGAFDLFALRAANRLVGNPDDAAALEITLSGPTIEFSSDHVVALVGAPFEATLDGDALPAREAVRVRAGQTLQIGRAAAGLRAYLGIAGGIWTDSRQGSRAPIGRARLSPGEEVTVGPTSVDGTPRRMRAGVLVTDLAERVLRAVPDRTRAFTRDARDAFFAAAWTVSPRSDRAGIRLDGDPVDRGRAAEFDPEGVVPGAVQVPGDGRPIVIGPDGPVTGGYPKIATVIAADRSRLAQARPGDTLRFTPVTVERGRREWRRLERELQRGIEDIG